MLTIEDVKLFLNDFPEANRLTKDSQFSTDRIRKAITYAIAEWNETPPLSTVYTEETFPYRSTLLYGVASWLFIGEATYNERNHLVYQSGGLTVDDDNNAQMFLNIGQYFKAEFERKSQIQKMAENIEKGWGHIGSDYYDSR